MCYNTKVDPIYNSILSKLEREIKMNISKLDQLLEAMPQRGIPACELAISKDGETIYRKLVGYSDSANFLRDFKKLTGVSPLKFRKGEVNANSIT